MNTQLASPRQPLNGYQAALERERTAWEDFHQASRDDPGYVQLLTNWQAAVALITIEAEKALVRFPKL